jgi:HD-GYP domain-containing protein (c-di-GMP phosphodiesterase class II)
MISTNSTLNRIQLALRTIDTLWLPESVRPRVETVLVRCVGKIMDRALPSQQGHGERTAALAETIGAAAGLCQQALHDLTLASLLHDIGLLTLNSEHDPDEHLDIQSYAAIQSHPRAGAEWLEPFRFLGNASVIIAHHHERWDGSGYPYGIRGTFIPLEARILAIADAFDAIQVPMVTDQTTRDRVAYRILTVAAGTQFDPELVDICGHCLRGAPISPID